MFILICIVLYCDACCADPPGEQHLAPVTAAKTSTATIYYQCLALLLVLPMVAVGVAA